MDFLFFRVGPCQRRTGLAQTETQLTEQSLTLPHAQFDPVLPLNPRCQGLAIPEIATQANLARHLAQHRSDLFQLLLLQSPWPSGALPLNQSSKATLLESMHPVLNCARRIP
jgi:hypothetical protein